MNGYSQPNSQGLCLATKGCSQFPFQGFPANDQEIAQLEADIQGLTKTLAEAFPSKMNWSKVEVCTQKEGLC